MRYPLRSLLPILALLLAPLALAQDEAIPHTFESGDVIRADQMNENFQAIVGLAGADGLPATCADGDLLGWDGTTWDCFTPATNQPRTETITIPGSAFVGLGATQIERDVIAENCLVKSSSTAMATAPLVLPQGSTITNVTYTHGGTSPNKFFSIYQTQDTADVEQYFHIEPAPSPGIESNSVDGELQIKEGHNYNIGVANVAATTVCTDFNLFHVAITYELP